MCNAFIDSHFNFTQLLRMFCGKTLYWKIEKIHHKTLKVIYESNDAGDNLLLQRNNVPAHPRHRRFLMADI